MIITTKKDFDKHILSLFKENPSKVRIATYGYRNIPEIQSEINRIKDCQLLIGLSPLRECATNCINCRTMHNIKMTKYKFIKDILGDKIGFRESMHTKLYYFELEKRKVAILGSRNLTGSDWSEINIVVDNGQDVEKVLKEFELLWGSRIELNISNLLDYEKIITSLKKHKNKNAFLSSVYSFYDRCGTMTDKQIFYTIKNINEIEGSDISYDLTVEKSARKNIFDKLLDKF